MLHDYKYYNLVAKEEQQVQKEINERKSQVIKMTNPAKRQIEWSKLFPKDLPVSDMVY